MLGFADIEDERLLTLGEIARRCGYARASSLRRALEGRGYPLPPAVFRGRVRGDVAKAWFAALPTLVPQDAGGEGGETPQERPRPASRAQRKGDRPAGATDREGDQNQTREGDHSKNVHSLDIQRQRQMLRAAITGS